jgi:DNA-binding transcriptional LysR family regulator
MPPTRDILLEIWGWLPLFRRVAETQSVSRAASGRGLSAPTVSRAVTSLEKSMGRRLFDRRGRKMVLNLHGEALLAAVTEAEDRLALTVGGISDRATGGVVRLASVGQYGRVFLARAARSLAKEFPDVQLSIVHADPDAALRALKERTLDLFLAANVIVTEPLVSVHLAKLRVSTYAGSGHPLFQGPQPTVEEVLSHGFAAQPKPSMMKSVWPRSLKRKVSLSADSHSVALEACLEGGHLVVMERLVAAPYVREGRLRELSAISFEPMFLQLCWHSETKHTVVDALTDSIKKLVQDLDTASHE